MTKEEQEIWENNKSRPKIWVQDDPARSEKPICFDLETYKWTEKQLLVSSIIEQASEGYVKPDTIKKYQDEALEKLALNPLTGQIILFGFYDGENFTHSIPGNNEKEIVTAALAGITTYLVSGYRLITKGGKRFDLPYLLTRAGILGVDVKFPYSFSELINKYKTFYHLDLENTFEKQHLGTLGYAFGVNNEPGNKGGEIAGMYESGDWENIIAKNSEDLRITYEIYQRLKWANL